MAKRLNVIVIIFCYLFAGSNHFLHPGAYIGIIPYYIPFPVFVNYLSGILEILFGLLFIFKATRRFAALAISVMLIAFLPVHIQMIIDAPFKLGTFTVSPWVAWARLVLQPVLIWWVWWSAKD